MAPDTTLFPSKDNGRPSPVWSLRVRLALFAASAALVAAAGLGAARWFAGRADARLREELLHHAKAVARTINPRRIRALAFAEEDKGKPEFERLSQQMAAYARAVGIRNLYSMVLRDGLILFGPESMAEGDPHATPPGTAYQLPPLPFYAAFETGTPQTLGPYTDEFGTFVSALAPVLAPGDEDVLMVVGIDVEASEWKAAVASARRRPLLFAGALVGVLAVGCAAIEWRRQRADMSGHPRHYAEPALCAAVMLTLTAAVAGLVHVNERHARQDVFRALANAQAASVAEEIRQVQTGLGSLVGFFKGSLFVDREEFRVFTDKLDLHRSVEAWVWCPEVGAEDIPALVEAALANGLDEYALWEEGPGGAPVPAGGRERHYPVLYIAPVQGYEKWLGFDLGSEPLVAPAVREAARTGLDTAAPPLGFDTRLGTMLIMFVLQPVPAGQQTGLAVAAVRLSSLVREAMLASGSLESGTAAGFFLFGPEGRPQFLACTSPEAEHDEIWYMSPARLSVAVPIFAFGHSFGLRVRPDEEWLDAHPLRYAWPTAGAGLALTALLTLLVAFFTNRQNYLNRVVRNRTAELREREAFIRAVLDNLPVGIAVNSVSPEVRFQYMNDQFPKIYRTTREALSEPDAFWGVVYEDAGDREEIKRRVLADCASGDPGRMKWDNIPVKRKGAETSFVSAQNVPVQDMGLMISMVWDVTDRKRAEEERDKLHKQLLQAQKMEAVGRLAGGVAHDFNNLLTAIKGYADFVKADLPEGSPSLEDIQEVINASDRAANLTRQLLAFSRRQALQRETLDLNKLVSGVLKMLGRILGEDIKIEFSPAEGLDMVHADAGQIEQALMNLAVNSRDAMPEGGTLAIATANAELDEMYAQSHPEVQPGPYVMLSVSDTGCGMDEETREHLFEPFFTTKELGKGTGLGLPMAYGIVKQHGGSVWVYSEVGQGTTFKIYLPRAAGEEAEEAPSNGKAPETPNGSETVLLVEDEEPVRKLAKRALENLGYTVWEARSAGEAACIFEKQGEGIALLLTDMVLPDSTGASLHKRLSAWRKSLKVLFMSGYSADRAKGSEALKPGVNYLQKPFTADALARKVREVLGG